MVRLLLLGLRHGAHLPRCQVVYLINRTRELGDAFEVGPGHDSRVIGEQPCVALDFIPIRQNSLICNYIFWLHVIYRRLIHDYSGARAKINVCLEVRLWPICESCGFYGIMKLKSLLLLKCMF